MICDTSVQELKYKALKEIATLEYEGRLAEGLLGAAERLVPGPKPSMRCCIYKERAVMNERLKMAMGGDKSDPNIIEVMPVACDECPVAGVEVTQACRGCIAHHCMNTCPKKAISIVDRKAHIDKSKCIECGRCVTVCPYSAIVKHTRPCMNACKPNAISINDDMKAEINNDKCIQCGACVYQCPFGAIMDKSFILDAIRMLRESENNTKYHVYAVVAPAISGQFNLPLGKVVAGIKKLGLYSVVEAALGADMVAYNEAAELAEKGILTSSCCPAFVRYIETQFPKLKENISHNPSPMVEISKHLKKLDPNSKVIFIGPCTAKKAEVRKEAVKPYVDLALTFEELQALFDSREIELAKLEEEPLDNASYYGRIFARCGGLAEAVAEALKEQGITEEQFKLNAVACDGIANCRMALLKAQSGKREENFIEGMACVNGCIGGAAALSHGPKNRLAVDKYGKEAKEKNIKDAIKVYEL